MKIKRYFAPDIRQAMRMVRDEQGPDAVILSNRRVDGGIEIMAATDYSEELVKNQSSRQANAQEAYGAKTAASSVAEAEGRNEAGGRNYVRAEPATESSSTSREAFAVSASGKTGEDPALTQMREELRQLRSFMENQYVDLTWNDFTRRTPIQAELIRRMLALGFSGEVARNTVRSLTVTGDIEQDWKKLISQLMQLLPVCGHDILDKGGVIALVGPTGVGKTTTIAKLATRCAIRRGARHVALITADNYRVGAIEQLRTYGRLLDVTVRQVADAGELGATLEDLSDKHLVLIDTAGMGQRDIRLADQFSILNNERANIEAYLVLAANAQITGLQEVVKTYSGIKISGCILSKLDESTSLGAAMDIVIQNKLPIAYISDGQRVPEDLHVARSEDIVNRAVSIMERAGINIDEEEMRFMMGRAAVHA